MAIRITSGKKSTIPKLQYRQMGITDDTEEVFIGTPTKNMRLLDEKDKKALETAIDNVEVDTTNLATKPELNTVTEQLAETSQQLSGFYNVKQFKCDDGQYVKGDGTHDDTTGIQRALDTAKGALFFPHGIFRITGGLLLRRNLDIVGASRRDSVIRADGLPSDVSALTVSFSDNYGMMDVRNWRFENISIHLNRGGEYSLKIKDGFPILTSSIKNSSLTKLYLGFTFGHSEVSGNSIEQLVADFGDANLVQKNMFFGNDCGITVNLENGVRNNKITDNTIVCRDGAITVLNGDNIRIINNQCEQPSMSQHPLKTMVHIKGEKRICRNIIIEENNFGGGTNLDRLVVLDNAYKCVVDKNYLVSVEGYEIELTEKAKYNVIGFKNDVQSEVENPRTRTKFKANVLDSGVGTVGVLKTLPTQNGWNINAGEGFFKDENGLVHFTGAFNAGITASGTVIGALPLGFRPNYWCRILCATSAGVGTLHLNSSNGAITVGSIPSNSDVLPQSFVTATTE